MNLLYSNKLILQYIFAIICMAWMSLIPDIAYAATLNSTLGASLCKIVGMMNGITGKSIATLGVMFLGIGSFFGKANFGLVLTTALGITIIFGAGSIAKGLGVAGADTVCAGISGGAMDTKIGKGLCEIARLGTGKTGKALATLGVVFVGLASFFGKVSWAMVITTATGIAGLFGAGSIVKSITTNAGWDGDCLPHLL